MNFKPTLTPHNFSNIVFGAKSIEAAYEIGKTLALTHSITPEQMSQAANHMEDGVVSGFFKGVSEVLADEAVLAVLPVITPQQARRAALMARAAEFRAQKPKPVTHIHRPTR